MKLTISPIAIEFIQKKMKLNPSIQGLRLGLKKTGCSGYAYDLNFIQHDDKKEADSIDSKISDKTETYEKETESYGKETELIIQEIAGINVMVDNKNRQYFEGTEIDCVKDDFGEYLKLINPNVKGECGCGESFTFNT